MTYPRSSFSALTNIPQSHLFAASAKAALRPSTIMLSSTRLQCTMYLLLHLSLLPLAICRAIFAPATLPPLLISSTMVPTALASPVNEVLAALNETSLDIHITPGIATDFTNSTLKAWPSEIEIPGFPHAALRFIDLGSTGSLAETEVVLSILENKVKEWKAGAGMSI